MKPLILTSIFLFFLDSSHPSKTLNNSQSLVSIICHYCTSNSFNSIQKSLVGIESRTISNKKTELFPLGTNSKDELKIRSLTIAQDVSKGNNGGKFFASLSINIDRFGEAFIYQTHLNRRQLYTVLKAYRIQNPCGDIYIYGPDSKSHEKVLDTLYFLQSIQSEPIKIVGGNISSEDLKVRKLKPLKAGKPIESNPSILFPPIPKTKNKCSLSDCSSPLIDLPPLPKGSLQPIKIIDPNIFPK
jgi:hypothetical protein